jgi:polyisoprenoid-binding protein YceI
MNSWLKSAVATALLAVPSVAAAAEYTIDPAHSAAQFSVRHMMVSNVRGEFTKMSGKVNVDEKDVTKSTVEATIDATSINTRVADRDTHLKSAEFLDTEKHPNITFKSKSVKAAGKGKLKVTGDLTIRGVTKEAVLDVEGLSADAKDPWGSVKRGATATTKINRKDFGLTWNQKLETGGVLVGDEVAIILDIQLEKVQAPPQATTK